VIKRKGERSMKLLKICTRYIMIIWILCLSGCSGGGAAVTTETVAETSAQTLGQELIDLKKAYDLGIISEKEYNDTKQRIIEKRTK
jgi:hypothetical protein